MSGRIKLKKESLGIISADYWGKVSEKPVSNGEFYVLLYNY
jgi:hypothetical protein